MTSAYLSLYSQDRPELGRGSGAERMCSCPSPAHEDRKPSCSVHLETGKWFCHACGEGGGVVKWLRLTRGLGGPEALETARRLGLAPEHGDIINSSRVNGRRRSAPNGQRPYRQPCSVDNAPLAALPLRYGACYRYRTPDGTEYARVFRYPENRPARKADPYTRRSSGKYAGTLDPPGPAEPLALPRRNPDGCNPGGNRRGREVRRCAGGTGGGFRSAELAGRQRRRPADGLGRAGGEGSDPVAGRRRSGAGGDGQIGRRARPHRSGQGPDDQPGRGPARGLGRGRRHREGRMGMGGNPAVSPPGPEQVDQQECRRLRRVAEKVLVTAEGIDPDRIDWIWEPYLPAGAVTLMAGAPGCGKSFLSIALAAELSRGRTPFHRRRTGKIPAAILSLEDDPARTIVPRLKACGADLGEIVIFDWRHPEADPLDSLSMREGTEGELLRVLREGVRMHGIRLVIIDTLTAFTPARMDGHEAVAVRQMMKPLARFAAECGVGVLVICHARKRSSHDSTHGVQATVLGSVDYVASCRSAVLVQKDPRAEDGTAGIMTHAKCNFGPLGPSLSFSIGGDGWKWGEERQETAEEIEEALLARRDNRRTRDREERRERRRAETRTRIEERIRTYLEENPGEGISTRELRENIEARCDTIAGVLNLMLEEGRLVRRRKGKQKVLWHLAGNAQQERTNDEDKRLKTGSRFETGSKNQKPRNRSS